jgi:hypothetical protein
MPETRSRFIIKDGQLFIEARPAPPVAGDVDMLFRQIQQQKEEIGRLNMELMSFPAANVKELSKERDAALDRLNNQVEYATALQRAIEHYCNGQVIPPEVASKCPHHADKLNAKAAVWRESYDLYSKRLAASINTGARIAELRNDMKEAWERFDK